MDDLSKIDTNLVGQDYTNDCILFRLLHETFIDKRTNRIKASCFNPEDSGLSTDWNKFCTPEQSLVRTGKTFRFNSTEFKNPEKYSVIKLPVKAVRDIQEITDIRHTPRLKKPEVIGAPNNPSHSSVFYIDEEVRLELKRIASHVNVNMDFVKEQLLQ